MHTIEKSVSNNLEKHYLINPNNSIRVEIIPSTGGIINKFLITKDDAVINIVDGYTDEELINEKFKVDFKNAKLSPFPNRIKDGKYNYGDKEYSLPINYKEENNCNHGFLFDKDYEVVGVSENEHDCSISLKYEYTKDVDEFPFNYDLIISYKLIMTELFVSTQIINISDVAIPIADGWHPQFVLSERINDLHLQFPSKEYFEVDDRNIPTGKLIKMNKYNSLNEIGESEFDDCFTLNADTENSLIRLKNKKEDLEINLEFYDYKNSYKYLQIYTPPQRNMIALEPMTCPPDVFNNRIDLIELQPNEEREFVYSINVVQ